MNPKLRVEVAMSLMRALWGEVTPDMRAVFVRVVGEHVFSIEFYIDGNSSEQLLEVASEIEGEVMGDFPSGIDISHKLIRLDAPAKIPVDEDGILIYLRKESI
ncbi:hypothetical protein [Aquilutibacter rugosus]|uniref:hypothetical protein n=1 Tax=Aquilutibacter rugosus TaxID=3115820 RepID=UPI002F3E5A4C